MMSLCLHRLQCSASTTKAGGVKCGGRHDVSDLEGLASMRSATLINVWARPSCGQLLARPKRAGKRVFANKCSALFAAAKWYAFVDHSVKDYGNPDDNTETGATLRTFFGRPRNGLFAARNVDACAFLLGVGVQAIAHRIESLTGVQGKT